MFLKDKTEMKENKSVVDRGNQCHPQSGPGRIVEVEKIWHLNDAGDCMTTYFIKCLSSVPERVNL